MIFIMNIINMTLDLNKILQFFITQIIMLESTILKLQAALDKMNTISKHVCPVVQEIPSKSTPMMRNSYVMIVKPTTRDTMRDAHTMTNKKANSSQPDERMISKSTVILIHNVKDMNLPYTPACSTECQSCMIRKKCFSCSQKKHIQKNYSMHSFEKICFLLNLKMNSVSQTDVKINMKLIMKLTAKSVINMNMHINLNENTQTVFTKKIHIVLSVMSQITFLNELKNELF